MIVPKYAAALSLIFVFLSIRTLRLRRKLKIPVGDGGQPEMLRAMRAHANFSEYVPLSLLIFYFTEQMGAHALLVNVLCLCLFLGRIVHAYGLSNVNENYIFRVSGMALTFTSLSIAALYILFKF